MFIVDEFVSNLQMDKVQEYRNLKIIPIKSDMAKEGDIQTLENALKKEIVEVTEVTDDDGQVPYLKFLHNGDGGQPIFVMCGSIITGNLQDRVVKTSFVLKPYQERKSDVACVESLRWGAREKGGISEYHISSDMRHKLRKSTQSQIWNQIKAKSMRMKVNSDTNRVEDIYQSHESHINTYREHFVCEPTHIGMIVLIDEKVIGFDLFGIKGLFPKLHHSVITSFIIDALDEGYHYENMKRKVLTVTEFLSQIQRARKKYYEPYPNEKVVMFESQEVTGGGLIEDETLLQLEGFVV